ncbi:hypothetical protein D3C80_982770 [compost metagenome]
MISQVFHGWSEDCKGQMVFTKNEPVRFQIVHRVVEFFDLRGCLVSAAQHLVLLAAHDGPGISLGDK